MRRRITAVLLRVLPRMFDFFMAFQIDGTSSRKSVSAFGNIGEFDAAAVGCSARWGSIGPMGTWMCGGPWGFGFWGHLHVWGHCAGCVGLEPWLHTLHSCWQCVAPDAPDCMAGHTSHPWPNQVWLHMRMLCTCFDCCSSSMPIVQLHAHCTKRMHPAAVQLHSWCPM